MTAETKQLSPRTARREKDVILLKRTWFGAGDFTLSIGDDAYVRLREQKMGESPTQEFLIERRHFNRLIDWYNAPQKLYRSAPKKRSKKRAS